ncbi:hypothetical protein Zmor_010257 [Zophobas morio]|uniref:Uncharacterized protein n=1 Tax=Zophobas morio TaxID=2755281 RepID=A0AA38MJT1_9CUCU|nr:hypothetical protein Zmor_010257 [Zophobas morio]
MLCRILCIEHHANTLRGPSTIDNKPRHAFCYCRSGHRRMHHFTSTHPVNSSNFFGQRRATCSCILARKSPLFRAHTSEITANNVAVL